MKKTISINIGNIFFNIDEDAFNKLDTYLKTIRGHFSKSDGQEEIMSDIESRIADLFQQKINDSKQVISIADVEDVIRIMGKPEDYILDNEDFEQNRSRQYESHSTGRNSNPKRLYRDPDNRYAAGVCSGIGYYFGFDPMWLRLAFAFSFLFFGSGFMIYFILWIIVPEAKTTSEKLEMRGEPVTFDNIGKAVENELGNLKTKFSDAGADFSKNGGREFGNRFSQFINEFFDMLAQVFGGLFRILGKVIGVAFVFAGVILLIAMLFSLTTATSLGVFNFPDLEIQVDNLMSLMVVPTWIRFWLYLSVSLLVIIPLLSLIYGGIKLITGYRSKNHIVTISATVIWVLAFFFTLTSVVTIAKEYRQDGNVIEQVPLGNITSDTLYITTSKDLFDLDQYSRRRFHDKLLIKQTDNQLIIGNPTLSVEKSTSGQYELELEKYARGSSSSRAEENAERIEYKFQVADSLISFNPWFDLGKTENFHGQSLHIILRVPEGKSVHFEKDASRIIYDVDNVTNTRDSKMLNKTWTMKKEGLTCINCNNEEL